MNSLRVHEVNNNPQLNTQTHDYARRLRPLDGATVVESAELLKGLNEFIVGNSIFGQTFDMDVEPRSDDGDNPQAGIIAFADTLGIRQNQLIMPYLAKHTTNVLVVSDDEQLRYFPSEGRKTGYNADSDSIEYDALIIKKNQQTKQYVLAITGADCPSVIGSAQLDDGSEIIFGIHAGRKGCLGGIIENTAAELRKLGVKSGTMSILVSAGGQTLELPLSMIEAEAQQNNHTETADIWQQSVVTTYSRLDSRQENVIYDNQADAIRRTQLAFNDLLAEDAFAIVDANTLTERGLKSYRGLTIAKKAGDILTAEDKIGRNAIYTRFKS